MRKEKIIFLSTAAIFGIATLLGILSVALKIDFGANKGSISIFKYKDGLLKNGRFDSVINTVNFVAGLGITSIIVGLGGIAISVFGFIKGDTINFEKKLITVVIAISSLVLILSAIAINFNRERLNDPLWTAGQIASAFKIPPAPAM